jgi:hypothetical protein
MYLILKQALLIVLMNVVALNGIFLLWDKLGFLEWIICRIKNNFLAKMLGCTFCLTHHLTLILIFPLLITEFHIIYLFIPVSVAGIIIQLR